MYVVPNPVTKERMEPWMLGRPTAIRAARAGVPRILRKCRQVLGRICTTVRTCGDPRPTTGPAGDGAIPWYMVSRKGENNSRAARILQRRAGKTGRSAESWGHSSSYGEGYDTRGRNFRFRAAAGLLLEAVGERLRRREGTNVAHDRAGEIARWNRTSWGRYKVERSWLGEDGDGKVERYGMSAATATLCGFDRQDTTGLDAVPRRSAPTASALAADQYETT